MVIILALGVIALMVLLLIASVVADYRSPQYQLARIRADLRWYQVNTEFRVRMAEQAIQRNADWARRGLE